MLEACGDPAAELRAAADFADLIVVSTRSGSGDLDALRIAGDVAVKSGRLVLAVPPECKALDLAEKALVAWDGSREANAALRAALPLLQLAGDVTVFEVNQPNGDFAVEDAAAFLSRHGVHAKFVQKATRGPVSDAILEKARNCAAAYIVMGAYGHGRAIENIFGGVTVGMLEKSEVPLFLTH